MFLINLWLLTASFASLFNGLFASSFSQRGPTGLNNRKNICYMNALLSSLYDVTPFRKAVYDHYEDSVLARALAGVFGRKQLNLVPALDLERDFMVTIQHIRPDWHFGAFQDIDEFLKAIFPFIPHTIANSIGFVEREELSTYNGEYIINPGTPTRNPMITVNLPEIPIQGLKLQDLVMYRMSEGELIDYRIEREDHPAYFERNGIDPFVFERQIQAVKKPKVLEYADVVPIFVARRTQMTGSNSRDFRQDELHVPEFLNLPLHDGQLVEYTLVSFAVYHPGHYFAYGKSYPSIEWFLYNDDLVQRPSNSDIITELEKNAVMLFYVKKGRHVACPLPARIENWSINSLIVQHIRSRLVDRIKNMIKKSKKANEKRR